LIYSGGAVTKENGRAVVKSTSLSFMDIQTPLTGTDYDLFAVAKPEQTSGSPIINAFIFGDAGDLFFTQSGGFGFNYNRDVGTTTDFIDGTAFTGSTRGDLHDQIYQRQSMLTSLNVNLSNATQTKLGLYPDFAYHSYSYQELIMFSSDKSSVRTDIEENIGDYFTQNTPLLDTYSGAAAAYSLRKLSSSYSGSAVEVYNGSSYADIGFNIFGELNTVALAAHCGSNDGFVSKWYDQAGSNDAAQTNTALMPKIYDGATTSGD